MRAVNETGSPRPPNQFFPLLQGRMAQYAERLALGGSEPVLLRTVLRKLDSLQSQNVDRDLLASVLTYPGLT